jgi:hypothetical protein
MAAVLALFTTAMSARERQVPPLVGFAVGPEMNEVAPKQFIVDPPTLENLGFRWYIEGDSNRNASVAVEFRKKGQAQWSISDEAVTNRLVAYLGRTDLVRPK